MKGNKRPEKIENVLEKIKECIEQGKYVITKHALDRQNERRITIPATLDVLINGYEEKRKTCFDENKHSWKYAIRGKTIRGEVDIRVIVSFDEDEMLIISVIKINS